jgi:hypothetical protein
MNKFILAPLAAFAATLAYASPADDVSAAAKKLADAPNYSWTRTSETANSQFPAAAVQGKAEKGGYTVTSMKFNDMEFVTVRKGEQSVSQGQDGTWQTAEERRAAFAGGGAGGGGGGGARGGRGGGFFGFGGGNQQNPAEEVTALVGQAKNLKSADGAITGDLSDEAVAQRLTFGGRGGQTPPAPKNASGTVKFWVKDGAITKYQTHVKGTVAGRQGDMERDTTTTIELKDVGSTKIDVPADAKKKLGS